MEKIYYLTSKNENRYLITVIATTIVGLLGINLILWFSDVTKQYPFVVILLVGFIFFQILYLINYYNKKQIAITATGIEYTSPRVAFKAKWQDLETISFGWHEQLKQEGVNVDKLKLDTNNSFQEIPSPQYFPRKSGKAFIPLSCFADNWRDSDLGQQIKQHAPHLFENEKSA